MQRQLFERTEIFEIGRVLGALLALFGGLALLIQSYFVDLIPPSDGFMSSTATVASRQQVGSFQAPVFFVTLVYEIPQDDATMRNVRSGQRVEFEQYYELSIGDEVEIHYNPRDVEEWRLELVNDELSQYGLGLLMLIIGILSLIFPTLMSWASRREDFEFTDELDDNELSGAKVN